MKAPGRIVNMSSIMASTGSFGRLGITVNAVAPGFLETELTASKDAKQRGQIARRSAFQRLATVNDVAEAVAFLLSDKAGNITRDGIYDRCRQHGVDRDSGRKSEMHDVAVRDDIV